MLVSGWIVVAESAFEVDSEGSIELLCLLNNDIDAEEDANEKEEEENFCDADADANDDDEVDDGTRSAEFDLRRTGFFLGFPRRAKVHNNSATATPNNPVEKARNQDNINNR